MDLLKELFAAHQKAESFRSQNNTNRYPEDFKTKVRETYQTGITLTKIQNATGININTLVSWVEPRYSHDCDRCVYLGQQGLYDLYFHPEPHITVIARYSNNGPDYTSGLIFARSGTNIILAEALKRAVTEGLIEG